MSERNRSTDNAALWVVVAVLAPSAMASIGYASLWLLAIGVVVALIAAPIVAACRAWERRGGGWQARMHREEYLLRLRIEGKRDPVEAWRAAPVWLLAWPAVLAALLIGGLILPGRVTATLLILPGIPLAVIVLCLLGDILGVVNLWLELRRQRRASRRRLAAFYAPDAPLPPGLSEEEAADFYGLRELRLKGRFRTRPPSR